MIEPYGQIKVKPGQPFREVGRRAIKTMREYVTKCSIEEKTPYIEEAALLMGVSDVDLREWAEVDSKVGRDFRRWYQNLFAMQKFDLKRKALKGRYNSKVASLLLSAEHNVVERIKKEVSGPEGESLKVEHQFSPEQADKIREGVQSLVEEVTLKKKDE